MAVFYHGTSKEAFEEIQKEGILFGKRGFHNGKEISRCTYLAVDKNEARKYGDIVLEVQYEPDENCINNNFFDDSCWQIRVYTPIPIKDIRILTN